MFFFLLWLEPERCVVQKINNSVSTRLGILQNELLFSVSCDRKIAILVWKQNPKLDCLVRPQFQKKKKKLKTFIVDFQARHVNFSLSFFLWKKVLTRKECKVSAYFFFPHLGFETQRIIRLNGCLRYKD